MTETMPSPAGTPSPLQGLDWRFLRRTGLSTVISVLIVSVVLAPYAPMASGVYFAFSLWATAFFGITCMILAQLGSRPRVLGLAAAKMVLMLAAGGLLAWLRSISPGGELGRPELLATLAGVTTPLAVVILRVFGLLLENQERASAAGRAKSAAGQQPNPSH